MKKDEGFVATATVALQPELNLTKTTGFVSECVTPEVYYNEHCIVFNSKHTPMKIERATFGKLLDFVETFPHYFVGQPTLPHTLRKINRTDA